MKHYEIHTRAFFFALQTLRMCKKVAETHRECIITKQLSRSSTSVGANLREGKNAISKKDFIYKLTLSQKECDETIYWLELMKNFIDVEIDGIDELIKEANEIMRIISSILVKAKANPSRA